MRNRKRKTRKNRPLPSLRPSASGGSEVYYESSGSWYGTRKIRRKTDWAGVSLGNAFKANIPYYERLAAERLFYLWCRRAQKAVAQLAGETDEQGFEARVRPQLSPCYTSYCDALAALAAIGLTSFLEFKARARTGLFNARRKKHMLALGLQDHEDADPGAYERLAEIIARAVQNRLLLEDLSRASGMHGFIELYRLFAASQHSLKFRSVSAILNAVVLYGDLFPAWESLALHPTTLAILQDVSAASTPFFDRLQQAPSHRFVQLGEEWIETVCRRLAPFIPELKGNEIPSEVFEIPQFVHRYLNQDAPEAEGKAGSAPAADVFPPLDGPRPPVLFGAGDVVRQLVRALSQAARGRGRASLPIHLLLPSLDDASVTAVLAFAGAVAQAGGQEKDYEDIRFDLLEEELREAAFSEGPLHGHPAHGHEIELRVAGDKRASGELFDRPVELSEDEAACAAWRRKAQPVTDALRRVLYPSVDQVPETERFHTSGALDPARLALSSCSAAVFKRYRIRDRADRRGSPVLLIACDGSGSLNERQMAMLKTLTWAWMDATAKSDVQMLAGLYHSGHTRPGVSGPLVQWMYHPHKTPAFGRKDALRTLLTLPDTGTGAQSDALSLRFMLDEACRLARGRMIYLILLSDCAWNRSFPELHMTGYQEVYAFFEAAYEDLGDKLHTTLVALGVEKETGFEDLLDEILTVPEAHLTDTDAVAGKIGLYVASIMQERHRLIAQR